MLLACSVDTPIHINRSHLLASCCASCVDMALLSCAFWLPCGKTRNSPKVDLEVHFSAEAQTCGPPIRPLHTKRQRQLMAMAMFPSILGIIQHQCWVCTNPLLLPMDNTSDSTLAQRNGNASARCEWTYNQRWMPLWKDILGPFTKTKDESLKSETVNKGDKKKCKVLSILSSTCGNYFSPS